MRITRKNLFIFISGILVLVSFCVLAALLWTQRSTTSDTVEAVVPYPPSPSEGPYEIAMQLTAYPTPTNRPPKTDVGRLDAETLETWKKVVSSTGLRPLKSRALDSDDIEIRIWQIPGLYRMKTTCWVFSREAGIWTGYALVDVDFKGKIVKLLLDTHSSGWRNWDAYATTNLSPPRLTEVRTTSDDFGNEGMGTIIEVKFGRDYARRYADNDLLNDLHRTIRSQIFNDDRDRWSKF